VLAAIENISTMHYNNMQQKQNAAGPRSFHNQRPMWQQQDAAATKHSSSDYLQQQLQLELMK